MSKKKADHLHLYKKVNLSRTKGDDYLVYKCIKPTCYHYLPTNLAEGKICECYRCGEAMVITHFTLTSLRGGPMARPHCPDCTKSRKANDVEAIAAFLDGNKT